MSLESIARRIRDAFDLLNRKELGSPVERQAPVPRPRASPPARPSGLPALDREGFAEEALPWMGAVHRFALRLTRGDEDRAADLVQETFLRAYRSWASFTRGTSCRSWLFTICKNSHLKFLDQASSRHEITESDLDPGRAAMGVMAVHERSIRLDLDNGLFDDALEDDVIEAIDALPDEYRDALVLSDLGDLNYNEISRVLDVPVGTVKSRLFRARRRLQEVLIDRAVEAGIIEDESA